MNFIERHDLDGKLSPFKRWDVIANTTWDLIWIFESVAYHWWRPDCHPIWKYIFADFSKAISKQWRTYWETFPDWCGDDDVYIDRRKSTLAEWYRLATEEEKELMEELLSKAEKNGDVTREMFDDQLSKLQAMWEKLWITIKIEE